MGRNGAKLERRIRPKKHQRHENEMEDFMPVTSFKSKFAGAAFAAAAVGLAFPAATTSSAFAGGPTVQQLQKRLDAIRADTARTQADTAASKKRTDALKKATDAEIARGAAADVRGAAADARGAAADKRSAAVDLAKGCFLEIMRVCPGQVQALDEKGRNACSIRNNRELCPG